MNQRVKFTIDGIEMCHQSSGTVCRWCDEVLKIRTDEEMVYGLSSGGIDHVGRTLIIVCDECGELNPITQTTVQADVGMPKVAVSNVINIMGEFDQRPVYNHHMETNDIIIQSNILEEAGRMSQLASAFIYTPQGNVAFRSECDDSIDGKYVKIRTGLWRKDCFTNQYYVEGNEANLNNAALNFVENVRNRGYNAAISHLES